MHFLVMNANINSITQWSYACAAIGYALLAFSLAVSWRGGANGLSLLAALAASAIWGATGFSAGISPHQLPKISGQLADILRSGGWYAFLLAALSSRLRDAGQGFRQAWLVLAALCVSTVGLVAQWMMVLQYNAVGDPARLSLLDSLLMAVFGLLLVEQLLRCLPRESVRSAGLLLLSLACGFAADIYLYAEALVYGHFNVDAFPLRAMAHVLIFPMTAIGALQSREWIFSETAPRIDGKETAAPEIAPQTDVRMALDEAVSELSSDDTAGLGAQVRMLVPIGNAAKAAQEVSSFKDVA